MPKMILRRTCTPSTALATLPPLLQRIYQARQIKSADETERSLKKLLPYDALLGIHTATEVLFAALQENAHLLIVGDFDADGATSTAIAVRALRLFGATNVQYLVPNRFAYGYGLTPELVAAARDYAPQYIVTVDNGIANHAGVKAAKQLGIKVVVTDHHLAADTLPDADAIVNPNQPNDPFPSKALAGCGVIFYVMLALRRRLLDAGWFQKKQLPEPNMASLLDIVALGTVADLVPLDQNNRILVHHGLERIRAGVCVPGIVALLEIAKRDLTKAVAADLGYAVAARLNAAGRLDDMSHGIECLLCDDATRAREIAKRLDSLNHERRSIEYEMQEQALAVVEDLTQKLQGSLPKGLCLFDESWHQGVIGILASRVKDRYHRPVIAFAPGQDGEIKGSARSIQHLHIRDALALIDAKYPNLIKKFGGHAMAAGLTLDANRLSQFNAAFDEVVSRAISEDDLEEKILTDGALNHDEMTLETAAMLREAGPWGQAFPEPLFDDVFEIVEQRIVGDKHLKLRLTKAGKLFDAIAFFVNTDHWPNHRCQSVQVVYRLDINEYKGMTTLQLLVDHLEPVSS